MDSGVYKITCIANGKIYIGSSITLKTRLRSHKSYLRAGGHHNRHLQNAFHKYGESAFIFEVIEYCNPDVIYDSEQYWIDTLQPFGMRGFNVIRNVTTVYTPHKHSEEIRAKISTARKGQKHSEETRARMSVVHRGVKHTEATRMKLRARIRTQETRAKLSELNSKTYIVTPPNGQSLLVTNLKKFSKEQGLDVSCLVAVARNRRAHHKGWRCEYAEQGVN